MTSPIELAAEIRRLHFGEHWPVGTIETQLKVHHDVVARVLQLETKREKATAQTQLIKPYGDFVAQTLKKYPTLRATRLYDMLRPRGYAGSVRTLRKYVATTRPRTGREVYLRTDFLIGEQAQVDWAHVGKIRVEGGERQLWLFVMVLSWSRGMWAEFVLDLSVHSLRRSLTRAAEYFGGSTRQWLFDNPKTVVLERHQNEARFHPKLVELSSQYYASLRLCAVRKANQKGRVERAIRYLRERFLAARNIHSIEQGNRELLTFFDEIAHARPHPTLPERTVAQCLAEEKTRLLALPKHPPNVDEVTPVTIDKTAFARFDTNVYSVPPEFAYATLTLAADDSVVRLLDGNAEVARHARCWGRRQRLEIAAHRQALLERKRGAGEAKGQDRLRLAVPGIDALFNRWLEAGRNMGSVTSRVLALLDTYTEDILAAAVTDVLARGMMDPGAVAIVCEQLRRKAKRPVPVEVYVDCHGNDRDVIPHSLEAYDVKSKRRG